MTGCASEVGEGELRGYPWKRPTPFLMVHKQHLYSYLLLSVQERSSNAAFMGEVMTVEYTENLNVRHHLFAECGWHQQG